MSYSVDEMPAIAKKVASIITDTGATIAKEESLGKLKFAYPIDKMSHGYYNVVEFDCEPTKLIDIDKVIKITHGVIRHLIVTKRIKSEKELAAEQKLRVKIAEQEKNRKSIFDEDEDDDTDTAPAKPKKARKTSKPTDAKEKEVAPKVDIADLDKKLDAILEGEDMVK